MAQVVENDIDVAPGEVLVKRRIVAAPHNRTRLVLPTFGCEKSRWIGLLRTREKWT